MRFRDFMSNFREVVEFRPFLEVQKNFRLLDHRHTIYHLEAGDLGIPNIYNLQIPNIYNLQIPNIYNLPREKFNFAVLRKHFRISRNSLLLLSSRNLNISQNKLYILNLQIKRFKMIYDMFIF